MSSPLMSCCRSRVMLFGATYSAAAVLMELEMNPEMKGRSIMFGSTFMGMTEISIRGRPMSVNKVVLTLRGRWKKITER